MFCPRCGKPLKEKDGEFECTVGKMQLSKKMAKNLIAAFIEKSMDPREFGFRAESVYRFGGKWHGPGCGLPMIEETPGAMRCPQCRRNLGSYIGALVELHPHL